MPGRFRAATVCRCAIGAWLLAAIGILTSATTGRAAPEGAEGVAASGGSETSGASGASGAGASGAGASGGGGETLISLNLPDNMELKTLIEFVSQRLKLNILYDQQVANRRITIRSPRKVPERSLLGLLESALRMNDLALVDAEQEGWKRIERAENLITVARPAEEVEPGDDEVGLVVSQVFVIEHAQTQQVDQVIRPLLTRPGGNSLTLPEQNVLIVTDYASRMARIARMVELVDRPGEPVELRFIRVRHLPCQEVVQQANQLLQAQVRKSGRPGGAQRIAELIAEARSNQIVLVGRADELAQAEEVIAKLDVDLGLETRVYQFSVVAPERVDQLTRELIGPDEARRIYRSAIDREGALLVVTSTEAVHAQLERLKADMDTPLTAERSPVRFYKLMNATAAEVLQTIQAIEGNVDLQSISVEHLRGMGRQAPEPNAQPVGPNRPPGAPGEVPPAPPSYREDEPSERGAGDSIFDTTQQVAGTLSRVEANGATITADPNTNTLIVVADGARQGIYAELIRMLDKRRPQVLVEIIVVALDTSDGFSLGVDIGAKGSIDDADLLTFSSFGLSEVDAEAGRLMLIPGLGFNGAILSADVADIVIRALKTNARARVLSAPKILVNDNATGSLSSVNEAAFSSVNASNTVATTSFAGYVEAGTDITVTPHISEGDHLNLDYSVAVNSFTGEGSDTLPPPRQSNTVQSTITIPDGYTVVVGGLNRQDESETISAVPLLGEIPWLENLFRSRSTSKANTTFFVFIRPVILRDDQFEDLKFLSRRDLATAQLPDDFPVSEPVTMQ